MQGGTITGNMKGTTKQDVYLKDGQTLLIGTNLYTHTAGLSVGITTVTATTESNPVTICAETDADYSRYFVCVCSSYN